jgi:DNA gyrase/topoisomerase IV subunit A
VQISDIDGLKKSGRKLAKVRESDEFVAVIDVKDDLKKAEIILFTAQGMAHRVALGEFPVRDGASLGVIAIDLKKGDALCGAVAAEQGGVLTLSSGKEKIVKASEVSLGRRGLRGIKLKGISEILGVVAGTRM